MRPHQKPRPHTESSRGRELHLPLHTHQGPLHTHQGAAAPQKATPKRRNMVALDLNLALVIHGGFEGIVGLLLLLQPQYVFPYIARRASYNNSERSLLRWFAFSIIVQAMVAFVAAVKLDARAKRFLLSAFLMYHLVIVADALYGYYLEGTVDEAATGLHAILVFVVGFLLAAGEKRARKSPKKGW